MTVESLLGVFGAVSAALGGYEGVKWIVNTIIHRKSQKRKMEAETEQVVVATENAIRDMYEDTIERISTLDEKRITEIRTDASVRITELNKTNAELHKQNLELLKNGAAKEEIIEDKTKKIRELNDLVLEQQRKIGKKDLYAATLLRYLDWLQRWHCSREQKDTPDGCLRRRPPQPLPLDYKVPEGLETMLNGYEETNK